MSDIVGGGYTNPDYGPQAFYQRQFNPDLTSDSGRNVQDVHPDKGVPHSGAPDSDTPSEKPARKRARRRLGRLWRRNSSG